MTRSVIIPAKGQSTRIKNKNRRLFHGRPILSYAIEVARASGMFEDIYISTEDKEIASLARSNGAKVVDRPKQLAEIGAPDPGTQEVTRHAIEELKISETDVVCCLYPCVPLLIPSDLQKAHQMLVMRPCSYVISINTDPIKDLGNFYLGYASHFLKRLPLATIHTGLYPIPVERACVVANGVVYILVCRY